MSKILFDSNSVLLVFFLVIVVVLGFLTRNKHIEEYKYMNDRVYKNAYVINLTETKEGRRRWKEIKEHREFKDKLTRVQGIYGANYDCSLEVDKGIITKDWDFGKWKNKNTSYFIQMSDGEIGVSLSHYYLWKRISELNSEGDACHLILEDDATRTCSYFNKKLTMFMEALPDDWDMFLLGFWLHKGDDGYKINKHITKVKTFVLCHAYIVREKSAHKFLKYTPMDMPLDSWISKHSDKINIYRHNYATVSGRPSSKLIYPGGQAKQIVNTNNW